MFTRKKQKAKILVHTDLAASERRRLQLSALHYSPSPRHGNNLFCQVSQECFALASLVIIVYLSCQSSRSPRCSSICMGSLHALAHWLRALAVPRCQPLFCAVTTGDRCSVAHCWASFAWCKSAHVGHGDKYGCAPEPVLD